MGINIYTALNKMETCVFEDEQIQNELKWQSGLWGKKTEQKDFINKALQVLGFRAFLFMVPGSAHVRMGHLLA